MISYSNKIFLLALGVLFSDAVIAVCETDINMGTHKITNLAAPTNGADLATKAYVDDFSAYSGGGWKTTSGEVYETKPVVGTGFNCTANTANCTVTFDGTVLVNWSSTSTSSGFGCSVTLRKNGNVVSEQAESWSIHWAISPTREKLGNGFVVLKVNDGDALALTGNGNCLLSSPLVFGNFQYTKLR